MTERHVPTVLSIAGSDSGGGAGIQADLKAIARCGAHGMTAITALTAQNTVGVTAIEPVTPAMIIEQIRAVTFDIGVDAVKVGMLGSSETIAAVAEGLDLIGDVPVVVDPVMVAESGADLLMPDARSALIEMILPRATMVTPNIPEARALTGLDETADQAELARAVHAIGPRYVVITGGHSEGLVDFFYDGERIVEIDGERYPGTSSHGSGCTHSSALATMLAHGLEPVEAARSAKVIASEAVRDGLESVGSGPGPVDVFGLAARNHH